MEYQSIVFDKIKNSLGESKEWINQVADVLHISKSAVYKRINGDTMLSMEDLILLMRAFNISFDDIVFSDRNEVGFEFPYTNRKIKSFIDYVEPLKEFVLSANQIPDLKVQYATNEFHFFFYFHDKDLTYFKFFMFAKTIWNLSSYRGRKFSLEDFCEWHVIKEDIDVIMKSYYQISNVEIWNGTILTNSLNQIIYFLKSGLFKYPEEALELCDKFELVINHISKMAEFGKKFLMGQDPDLVTAKFEMYHNEITHTNNILLMESPQYSQLYFAFDNPNYIITDEKELLKYTNEWFKKIKKSALPISLSADRNRREFFTMIRRQIESAKKEISYIIEHKL